MAATTQDIRNALLSTNPEFQKLAHEHTCCESQLEELQEQKYLNSEDLMQEILLKKRKLRLKDQMEQLIARHQREFRPH
jgi:uncharacterized protein YdcH (DUF465 family)